MPALSQKFQVLNRETAIIAELLTGGLENLRKISEGHAYYYQSFYALSMGLERLIKLILHLEQPTASLKQYGHNLRLLSNVISIKFPKQNLESKILSFLNDFSNGERYSIIDYLSGGDKAKLAKEPIVKFYKTIMAEVIKKHPPRKVWVPPEMDIASVLHTREDLSVIDTLTDLSVHGQLIEHTSRYCVMYVARMLRPFVDRLATHDGPPKNPCFSEHFRFLSPRDIHYLERKTYRS